MEPKDLSHLLPDYWAGNLSRIEKQEVEHWLQAQADSDAQHAVTLDQFWQTFQHIPLEQPNPSVKNEFYALLESYPNTNQSPKQNTPSSWLKFWPQHPTTQVILALGLFLVGIILGPWLNPSQYELREQVNELNQTITSLTMLQEASVFDRMQAVEIATQLRQPNEKLINALLETLDHDPNVNVRLAAIQALGNYYDHNAIVRERMSASLQNQESPLVKAGLVDLLIEENQSESVLILEEMLHSELDPSLRTHILNRLESIKAIEQPIESEISQ